MARFAIAALGAPTHVSPSLAKAYSEYLTDSAEQDEALVAGAAPSAGAQAAAYYEASRSMAAPRWSGGGLSRLGLADGDLVDADDLAVMLAGRLPATGERLLGATGNHGRVHLQAGQPTLTPAHGEPLWSAADAQARCRLRDEVWAQALEEAQTPGRAVGGLQMWSEPEIEAIAATPTAQTETARRVTAGGKDLTVVEAAELTGFDKSYLRKLCANYEKDPDGSNGQWLKARRFGPRQAWRIARVDLAEFLDRREPPSTRFCYDATFTVSKSVSVMALLSSDQLRAQVVEALLAANRRGLNHLDLHASCSRATIDGERVPIQSDGLAVASYLHATSRADDPALHVHNVILNAVRCEDGVDRAVNAAALYRESAVASTLAEAQLRWTLATSLGVRFEPRDDNRDIFEIAGIDAAAVAAFSKRRSEIESAWAELRKLHGDDVDRQAAVMATRQPKTGEAAEVLRRRWLQEAAAVGVTPETLAALCGAMAPPEKLTEAERADLWAHLDSDRGAARNHSVFTKADALKAALRWLPEGSTVARPMSADVLDEEVTLWLAGLEVRGLKATAAKATRAGKAIGALEEPLYTTARQVRQQIAIESAWEQGLHTSVAVCPREVVEQVAADAAAQGRALSTEQHALVLDWCTSGHLAAAAVGRPGAGKTFTMASAAKVWHQSGYRVLGAAVKGEAARLLGDEAGIDSETVAMRLSQIRRGELRLDSRTVLIVDESSTLSDADLRELLDACQAAGCALRTLGDPAQHTSVAAAGMWTHLVSRYAAHTPELTEHRRLQSAIDAEAADLARAGDVKDALEALRAAGQLTEASGDDVYALAVNRWNRLRTEGRDAPIVTRDNAARRILNELCQRLLVEAGEVEAPRSYGDVRLGVGDSVLARRTDRRVRGAQRSAFVRNGARGTVTAAGEHQVTVDFDGIGAIDLPARWVAGGGADLAYCVTSYAVQGATQPASTSVIAQGATLPELVVDITRGKRDNHVIITDRNDAGELQRWRQRPKELLEEIAGSIEPVELTPAAVLDSSVRAEDAAWASESLAALDQAHKLGLLTDHEADVFEHRRLRRLSLLSRSDPSSVLAGHAPQVGERAPASLRHAAADAAEAVTSYRDRYGPRRDSTVEHGALLGYPPSQSAAAKRRRWYQRAIDALKRLTRSQSGASERRGLPEPAREQPAPAPAPALPDWSDFAEHAPADVGERPAAEATDYLQGALEDHLHPEPDLSIGP